VTGIEKNLGSGLITGTGPVMAKQIVKKFEQETLYRKHLKLSSLQMPGQDMRILLRNTRSWQDISHWHPRCCIISIFIYGSRGCRIISGNKIPWTIRFL
jgi:hypothetical protein